MNGNFLKREECPICNEKKLDKIYSSSFLSGQIWPFLYQYYSGRISKEKLEHTNYTIVHCPNCKFIFQENVLNDQNMFLLYEEWISPEESLNKKKYAKTNLFRNYLLEINAITSFIKKDPHEIRVLEYGMGWGHWANLADAFNFNVTGVELSKKRIDFAQKRGLKIVEDVSNEKNESYDYIYSDQVFEHIPNPKETLFELARILKKDGLIRIKVPDGRGIEKKLRRADWQAQKDALHPLEHINCFNRNSLKELVDQVNLSILPPPYCLDISGVKVFLRSQWEYFYNSRVTTQVYLAKRL